MSLLARSSAVALFAFLAGCAVSESRWPLNVSAADAPHTYGPIAQCATSMGLNSQVSEQKDQIQVFNNGGATIVYRIDEGKFYEEISILSSDNFTEADRQRKIQEAKPIADKIWACAQRVMQGGAP